MTGAEIRLTDEDVVDIMASAAYGCAYWCDQARPAGCDDWLGGDNENDASFETHLNAGGKIAMHDAEDDVWYELDRQKFMHGFQMWYDNGYDGGNAVQDDGTVDCCGIDSLAADCIIQFALFDDVIFG